MERFQGIIGILVIFALIYAFSRARKHIRWRTLGVGLALQIAFALLALKWDVGFQALVKISEGSRNSPTSPTKAPPSSSASCSVWRRTASSSPSTYCR